MLIVKHSFKEIERDLTMLKDHNFHNQQIRETATERDQKNYGKRN